MNWYKTLVLRLVLWIFIYPILIPIGILSYPICKAIPKYRPYCSETFKEYMKELWWGIKTDWKDI